MRQNSAVQHKMTLLFSLALLLVSLVFLSLPASGNVHIAKKPIASLDLLQSKNKNPQLVTQAGTSTRSWAILLFASQMNGWTGSLNGEVSGVRSRKEQRNFYEKFLKGEGPPAFSPDGPSRHILENIKKRGQWSQAVDVSRPRELIKVAASLGVDLYQPYSDEPWHVEARSPFKLSGFFPGSNKNESQREPISSLLMLGIILFLVVFFSFSLVFEARKNEERPVIIFSQTLLLISFALLLLNVLDLDNNLSFIALALSSLATALLLLIPLRPQAAQKS